MKNDGVDGFLCSSTEGKYILKGKKVIKETNLLKWAEWFETADRHVKNTKVGGVQVSTVFLGLDHNFFGGKPLLFETMIFGGRHDGYQERYTTWEEAEKGHKKASELVKSYFTRDDHGYGEAIRIDERKSGRAKAMVIKTKGKGYFTKTAESV